MIMIITISHVCHLPNTTNNFFSNKGARASNWYTRYGAKQATIFILFNFAVKQETLQAWAYPFEVVTFQTPPKLSLAVAFVSSTPVRTKGKKRRRRRRKKKKKEVVSTELLTETDRSPPATCICTPARLHSCAHLLAVDSSNHLFPTRLTRILDPFQNTTTSFTLLHHHYCSKQNPQTPATTSTSHLYP